MTKKGKIDYDSLREGLSSFQKGWIMIDLDNLCEFKRGPFGSAVKKSMFVEKSINTYKVYEQGNAIRKNVDYGDYYINENHFNDLKNFEVKAGDIIISCAGTIGETFVIPKTFEKGIINQALLRVRTSELIDTKYFLYAFEIFIKEKSINSAQGTAIKNLPPISEMKKMKIPLPPINEQKRIVEKVERLLGKIDEAKRLIEEAKETFELRRAAILDKAFSGELTAKWRIDNLQIDSVDILLKNIKLEKENEGRVKKVKGLKEPDEIEKPFDIPNTWKWVTLHQICSHIADIDHKMPKAVESGIKFLSAKDLLDDGTLNFTVNVKLISIEDFERLSRKIKPKRGDIIYSRIGARLGKSRVVGTDENFLVSYSCCVIRPIAIDVYYLNSYLDSGFVLEQALSNTRSIGVPDLGMGDIKNFMIPIPPISEQKYIAQLIKAFINREVLAFKKIEQFEDKLNILEQSILFKAFNGQLGTNDLSVEDAIELLKSILKE